MDETQTLLQEVSPDGNLEVAVDQDARVVHMYLRAPNNDGFGLKSCWVRNLTAAPENLDVLAMRDGQPPLLPARFCAHPNGQPALNAQDLQIVWFPEGDGVALFEQDELLAAIPGWSEKGGFHGYARDCRGEGPLCWELGAENAMHRRIAEARRYWAKWDRTEELWPRVQERLMAEYERALGRHSRYFAIDGGAWPPRGLALFEARDRVYLLTIGLSIRPQPVVEMYTKTPEEVRRIELGACFDRSVSMAAVKAFASYMSSLASLPWQQITFLGDGHTVGCDVFGNEDGLQPFSAVLLAKQAQETPEVVMPQFGIDRVPLLWCVPITAAERELAESSGSRALISRFSGGLPPVMVKPREPVVG